MGNKYCVTESVMDTHIQNSKFELNFLAVGMAEKPKALVATGIEIYYGNLPEGAKELH